MRTAYVWPTHTATSNAIQLQLSSPVDNLYTQWAVRCEDYSYCINTDAEAAGDAVAMVFD